MALNITFNEKAEIISTQATYKDFFEKLTHDGFNIEKSAQEQAVLSAKFTKQNENIIEVQNLVNELFKMIDGGKDKDSIKLSSSGGATFEFTAHQIVWIWLMAYQAHSEFVLDLLEPFIDYSHLSRGLSEHNGVNQKSGNNKKWAAITEYFGTKLFDGFDGDLRNAIAHFDIYLDGAGIHYFVRKDYKNMSLKDFMLKSKKLNIGLAATLLFLQSEDFKA